MRSAHVGRTAGMLALLLAAAMGTGCLAWNVNSAKTLPPDGSAWTFGFTTGEGAEGALPIIGYRYAPVENFDFGVSMLRWITVAMDGRYQFLNAEEHGIDSCAEFGVGFGAWTVLFGGIAVSKEFGNVSPYIHYRYVGGDFIATELLEFLTGATDQSGIQEVSVGVRIGMGEKFALIPEVVFLPEFDDAMLINFAFQFGKW